MQKESKPDNHNTDTKMSPTQQTKLIDIQTRKTCHGFPKINIPQQQFSQITTFRQTSQSPYKNKQKQNILYKTIGGQDDMQNQLKFMETFIRQQSQDSIYNGFNTMYQQTQKPQIQTVFSNNNLLTQQFNKTNEIKSLITGYQQSYQPRKRKSSPYFTIYPKRQFPNGFINKPIRMYYKKQVLQTFLQSLSVKQKQRDEKTRQLKHYRSMYNPKKKVYKDNQIKNERKFSQTQYKTIYGKQKSARDERQNNFFVLKGNQNEKDIKYLSHSPKVEVAKKTHTQRLYWPIFYDKTPFSHPCQKKKFKQKKEKVLRSYSNLSEMKKRMRESKMPIKRIQPFNPKEYKLSLDKRNKIAKPRKPLKGISKKRFGIKYYQKNYIEQTNFNEFARDLHRKNQQARWEQQQIMKEIQKQKQQKLRRSMTKAVKIAWQKVDSKKLTALFKGEKILNGKKRQKIKNASHKAVLNIKFNQF